MSKGIYIDEDIPVEEDPCYPAITIETENTSDELQTVTVRYVEGTKYPGDTQILYHAKPSCKHMIQAQWSGIKCVKCGGWYCA